MDQNLNWNHENNENYMEDKGIINKINIETSAKSVWIFVYAKSNDNEIWKSNKIKIATSTNQNINSNHDNNNNKNNQQT